MKIDDLLEGMRIVVEEVPRIVFVEYPHVFATVYWFLLLLIWP